MAEIKLSKIDDAAEKAARGIPKNVRLAFLFSVSFGLLLHGFALFNKLVNRDEIPGLFASHDRTVIGRFFLSFLRDLFSNYSLPFVNGLVAILSLSAAAALTVAILRIRKPLNVILSCAALLAFPTVGNFLSYMHTADANAIGLLIGVIGAYFLDRTKWGFLPAAALFSLSLGTYQANICFIGALMALRGLEIVLQGERSDRDVLLTIARYVLAFGLGAALYSGMNSLVLAVKGQELVSYMGISEASNASLADTLQNAAGGYRDLYGFLTRDSQDMTTRLMPIAHGCLAALSTLLFLLRLTVPKSRTALQTALAVIVYLLLPLAFNSIVLFNPELVHILMRHSAAFFYILPLLLLEDGTAQFKSGRNFVRALASYAAAALVLLSVWSWSLYTNEGYLLQKLKYDNIYALLNRVVDSIECSPEYVQGMPVAFLGEPAEGNYPPTKEAYLDAFFTGVGYGDKSDYGYINDDKHVQHFIRYYIGVGFAETDEGTRNAIEALQETCDMPCYPEAGSIRKMDDVLVVKLGAF